MNRHLPPLTAPPRQARYRAVHPRQTTLARLLLALLLVLTTQVAGMGRAVASVSTGAAALQVIPGVAFVICHDGPGRGAPPVTPAGHCDTCTLCAPLVLPGGPLLAAPVRTTHVARPGRPLVPARVVVRLKTPRSAQGPPAA